MPTEILDLQPWGLVLWFFAGLFVAAGWYFGLKFAEWFGHTVGAVCALIGILVLKHKTPRPGFGPPSKTGPKTGPNPPA